MFLLQYFNKTRMASYSQGRAAAGSSPGDFAASDSFGDDAMPYDRQLLQDPLNEVYIYEYVNCMK